MVVDAILSAVMGVVEWLAGRLPDGPAWAGFAIPATWRIPVPAWIATALNSATGVLLTAYVGLTVWDVGSRLVRSLLKLVLGNRGDAL